MLMDPETIKSIKVEDGKRRHILREGKRPDGPPSSWPICLCTFLNVLPESLQEHEDIEDVDDLCKNCKKRMVNRGR